MDKGLARFGLSPEAVLAAYLGQAGGQQRPPETAEYNEFSKNLQTAPNAGAGAAQVVTSSGQAVDPNANPNAAFLEALGRSYGRSSYGVAPPESTGPQTPSRETQTRYGNGPAEIGDKWDQNSKEYVRPDGETYAYDVNGEKYSTQWGPLGKDWGPAAIAAGAAGAGGYLLNKIRPLNWTFRHTIPIPNWPPPHPNSPAGKALAAQKLTETTAAAAKPTTPAAPSPKLKPGRTFPSTNVKPLTKAARAVEAAAAAERLPTTFGTPTTGTTPTTGPQQPGVYPDPKQKIPRVKNRTPGTWGGGLNKQATVEVTRVPGSPSAEKKLLVQQAERGLERVAAQEAGEAARTSQRLGLSLSSRQGGALALEQQGLVTQAGQTAKEIGTAVRTGVREGAGAARSTLDDILGWFSKTANSKNVKGALNFLKNSGSQAAKTFTKANPWILSGQAAADVIGNVQEGQSVWEAMNTTAGAVLSWPINQAKFIASTREVNALNRFIRRNVYDNRPPQLINRELAALGAIAGAATATQPGGHVSPIETTGAGRDEILGLEEAADRALEQYIPKDRDPDWPNRPTWEEGLGAAGMGAGAGSIIKAKLEKDEPGEASIVKTPAKDYYATGFPLPGDPDYTGPRGEPTPGSMPFQTPTVPRNYKPDMPPVQGPTADGGYNWWDIDRRKYDHVPFQPAVNPRNLDPDEPFPNPPYIPLKGPSQSSQTIHPTMMRPPVFNQSGGNVKLPSGAPPPDIQGTGYDYKDESGIRMVGDPLRNPYYDRLRPSPVR